MNFIKEVEKFVRSKLPNHFVEEHVVHVVQEADWLCKFYPKADREVAIIGAWMHDVGHKIFGDEYYDKLGKPMKEAGEHHIVGAEMTEIFLKSRKQCIAY